MHLGWGLAQLASPDGVKAGAFIWHWAEERDSTDLCGRDVRLPDGLDSVRAGAATSLTRKAFTSYRYRAPPAIRGALVMQWQFWTALCCE